MTAPGHVFVVEGAASSQLPLRLLGFFAQQDLLPATFCMTRSTSGLAMRIVASTLDERRAGVILAKMQALPDVASALLTQSQGASCLIGEDG